MAQSASVNRAAPSARREHPARHSHVAWEVSLIPLLLLALQLRDARIAWFEAEDRRKAREIDRLAGAAGGSVERRE